jgi:propanol-preferring alcohol dehydrogenase
VQAVRFYPGEREFRIEDVTVREPRCDEVLVRVGGAGVCRSDLHIIDGELSDFVREPVTLGHEVAGVVEAVGPDVDDLEPGGGVAVMVGWGCGHCEWCVGGSEQLCPQGDEAGATCDGGFAELMLVPHRRHLVPLGELDPLAASPFGCAALSAYAAVKRVTPSIGPGHTVAVLGIGGLGEFALQLLGQLTGGAVVAIDERSSARRRAREIGVEACATPAEAAMAVEVVSGGRGASAVIDFVGSEETLALAAGLVARGGVVALLGLAGGTVPFGFFSLAPEASLTTVFAGSVSDLQAVVRLAERGAIESRVVQYPLEEVGRALDDLRAGEVQGRAVLVPS